MQRSVKHGVRIGGMALMLGLLSFGSSWAKWAPGTDMPVARLLKNVQAYVQAHPKEAGGYWTLGRINSAAFAADTETIHAFPDKQLPTIPTYGKMSFPLRNKQKTLSPRALTYLSDALSNYKRATELDAAVPEGWFGLGFQCEEALRFPETIVKASAVLHLPEKPSAEQIRQEALRDYRKAYAETIRQDPLHMQGLGLPLSIESAEAIVRLQQNHTLSPAEQKEQQELQKLLTAYKNQQRPVSPILISFDRQASLADLLAPEKHVRFDLAGDGLGRLWPWVKPTTGILVWDPKHTGKITSGLQLFGNVTWWLFWKDGYEPLAALDNDHNGWLEGAELQGISVWFDRNGDGIAEPGEVVSLASLGIKRIAVHSAGLTDGVPANPNGVQLRDGSFLSTFDWTPTSLPK